jgi:hypothetical protein
MSDNSGVYAATEALGIDLNSLDADSDFETPTESTEAEGEASEEGVKEEGELTDENEDSELEQTDGEETQEAQEKPAEETPKEEPQLTAKEHQELQAAREELAKERQAFTEERAQVEKELREQYSEKLTRFDELDAFLADYAERDPDAFGLFKNDFQEYQRQYSNPVINSLKTQIESLTKEVGQFKAKASDEVTLTKLDTELKNFMSTTGKEAEAAGIKIDSKVIEDLWAKGLTVEEAFNAKYGAAFLKLSVSKAKAATVEKKVQARPPVATAGNVNRSNSPVKEAVPTNAFDAVRYYAKQLTGKSA